MKVSIKPILLGAIIILTLLVSGCTRCVSCTDCNPGVQLESSEYCENDFNSKEDFDQAIDLAESFGCSCVDN